MKKNEKQAKCMHSNDMQIFILNVTLMPGRLGVGQITKVAWRLICLRSKAVYLTLRFWNTFQLSITRYFWYKPLP